MHVFSPTLTNEFVFAQANFVNPIHLTNPDAVNPDKLGFKMTGLFSNPFMPQIPNVCGWNNAAVGFATYPYGAPWPAGGANAFGKLSQTPNISRQHHQGRRHAHPQGRLLLGLRAQQPDRRRVGQLHSRRGGIRELGCHSTGNPLADHWSAAVPYSVQPDARTLRCRTSSTTSTRSS